MTKVDSTVVADEPVNRRRKWDRKMADAGYKRMTVYVLPEQVPVVEALKHALRYMSEEQLRYYQGLIHEGLVNLAALWREGLEEDPSAAVETTIVEEIAVLEAAAAATKPAEGPVAG